MTMDLNKRTAGDNFLWSTDDYRLLVSAEGGIGGYEIINSNTGAIEMFMDQEPQALMGLMWLQEQYDEVMGDPQREYKVRQNKRKGPGVAGRNPLLN